MKSRRHHYIKRINELKNAKNIFEKEGILNEGDKEKTENKINKILYENLLPKIKKDLYKIINKLDISLCVLIDYIPKEKFDIKIPKKININEKDILKVSLINPTSQNNLSINKNSKKKSKKTILSVTFKDGKTICEKKAKDTFAKAIEYIGITDVKNLNLKMSGKPLISEQINSNKSYFTKVQNGYYICTHSSTYDKKKILDEISKKMNIGIKTEII